MELRKFAVAVAHRVHAFANGRYVLFMRDRVELTHAKKLLDGPEGLSLWKQLDPGLRGRGFVIVAEQIIEPLLLLGASNDVFINTRRERRNAMQRTEVDAAQQILRGLYEVMLPHAA